jgi:hypothetical protein
MGFLGSRKPVLLGREDWIVLALAVAKRNLQPIQLHKLLALLGRQFPKLTSQPFYAFGSANGEQLSVEVNRDANLHAMLGVIAIDTASGEREYRLTPRGVERARDLESRADPEALGFLRRMAAWVRTRSVDQLRNGPAEPTTEAPPPSPKPLPLRRT